MTNNPNTSLILFPKDYRAPPSTVSHYHQIMKIRWPIIQSIFQAWRPWKQSKKRKGKWIWGEESDKTALIWDEKKKKKKYNTVVESLSGTDRYDSRTGIEEIWAVWRQNTSLKRSKTVDNIFFSALKITKAEKNRILRWKERDSFPYNEVIWTSGFNNGI